MIEKPISKDVDKSKWRASIYPINVVVGEQIQRAPSLKHRLMDKPLMRTHLIAVIYSTNLNSIVNPTKSIFKHRSIMYNL